MRASWSGATREGEPGRRRRAPLTANVAAGGGHAPQQAGRRDDQRGPSGPQAPEDPLHTRPSAGPAMHSDSASGDADSLQGGLDLPGPLVQQQGWLRVHGKGPGRAGPVAPAAAPAAPAGAPEELGRCLASVVQGGNPNGIGKVSCGETRAQVHKFRWLRGGRGARDVTPTSGLQQGDSRGAHVVPFEESTQNEPSPEVPVPKMLQFFCGNTSGCEGRNGRPPLSEQRSQRSPEEAQKKPRASHCQHVRPVQRFLRLRPGWR